MNQEKELERHNKILEQISSATTRDELPNITLSNITSYLANNVYFDGNHLSQSLFKPVLDAILKYGTFINNEVQTIFLQVLKDNYPEHSEQEFVEKYKQIVSSPRISNILVEVTERNKKIQQFVEKEDLDKHNQILKEIRSAYEIKDLPKVGRGTLNKRVQDNTKNDFIDKISMSKLYKLSQLLYEESSSEEIETEIYKTCQEEGLSVDDTKLMVSQIISQIFSDKAINYIVEELKAKEERIVEIYKMDHDETMDNIKNATRISQLPPNLTFSILANYLAGNTTIYPNGIKISPTDLKNVTDLLLEGKTFESEEIKNELMNVVDIYYTENKEEAYKLLLEKLANLPRINYMVEEINYSQKRQREFIGRSCSNVNVYFVPNPKSPIDGGRFYNCYINRVDNLDLSQILPSNIEDMDVDGIEWYVRENYDETFKIAGGIILNKDETIGNVNVFKPMDGKISITPEEKTRYDELQELSVQVKDIIKKKKEETEKFKQLQEAYFKYQLETDEQLSKLEAKIDSLTNQSDRLK